MDSSAYKNCFVNLVAGIMLSYVVTTSADSYEWGVGSEYYSWREFKTDGSRLLEERGPRFFVSLDAFNRESKRWDYGFHSRVYGALVLYDGQTQLGNPLVAETSYFGLDTEIDFTRWLRTRNQGVSGRGWAARMGVGYDFWMRNIIAPGGYIETYAITYARIAAVYQPSRTWSSQLGVKYPFATYETAGITRVGFSSDPILHPKGKASLYASVDYQLDEKTRLIFYYDSYRFAQSDLVTVPSCPPPSPSPCQVYQPTSHQDTLGIRVNYRF